MSGDTCHKVLIEANLDEESLLAVEPEAQDTSERSLSYTRIDDGTLTVESDDLVSVRASLNGWIRLIRVAEKAGTSEDPTD